MSEISFHIMADGRRIAHRYHHGRGPTLVFLPGYMSDMDGSKATALMVWAKARGQSCLLLDYSGCGQSSGELAEGSLTRWREEVLEVIKARTEGPLALVGSSMGGWLMLLCGLLLGERLAGMVGIAAAPDFTEWGYDEEEKARLAMGETVYQPSDYGYEPMPTHALFWSDGEMHKQLGGPIAITCPVRLLHGQRDEDVPWRLSLQLASRLDSGDVQICLVKSGDHRLSRDEDVALLLKTLSDLG
jgi:pimeloyl-ACP methyl ester carboxylesterase